MKTAKISGIISAAATGAYLIGSSIQAAQQQAIQRVAGNLSYDPVEQMVQEKAAELGTHGLSSTAATIEAGQVVAPTVGSAAATAPVAGGGGGSLLDRVFSPLQRFASGALGGTYRTLDAAKFQDLWANARYNQWAQPLRGAWSGVQAIGLLRGGASMIAPYSELGTGILTIDQAQTISAIRGIRLTATIAATSGGAELGFALGTVTFPPSAPVTAGIGAAAAGSATDKFLGWLEKVVLQGAGYPTQ